MHEVGKLIKVLHALVEKGASVVVIEHNTDMILGIRSRVGHGLAAKNGGLIVSSGTPEVIVADPNSITGRFLMQERIDRRRRHRDLAPDRTTLIGANNARKCGKVPDWSLPAIMFVLSVQAGILKRHSSIPV